jgi:hypothetical protein
MNKATSWEDKYSEIEEAYRYAESVRSFLFACMGVNPSYGSKREFEAIGIQDAIDQLKNQADNLRAVADLEKIDRILGRDSNNILKVLRSCDLMLSALTEISTLEEAPAKLPVDKIRFFREIPEDILHLSYSGFSKYVDLLVRAYGKIVDLLQPGTFNRSQTEELETVYRSLPGILAYQNSSTANKPKRGRRSKADLKSRSNRELLIAILLKHHRYESKNGLNLDPISTEEARKQLGKSVATLSKTWKEIQPTLTYANYAKLCGRYESLEKLLKAIDSKEGYLERSNKEEAIDNSEG